MNSSPQQPEKSVNSPAGKTNRGWFRRDDTRINRQGRPRGAVTAAMRAQQGQPLVGRLRKVFLAEALLRQCLAQAAGRYITNLPADFRIVAATFDAEQNGFLLTIHSDTFAPVKAGEPIPEFSASLAAVKGRVQVICRDRWRTTARPVQRPQVGFVDI